MQKFTGKMPRPRMNPEHGHTLCASLRVEMHFNISQDPLFKFTGKMPGPRVSKHPDEAPAFTLSVGTSQCGHTVWGKTVLITGFIS